MPSSRSSGFPTIHPSFSKHRYNEDPRSLPLKINLSVPIPLPAWASLPTPPMSGTPPPEQPLDPYPVAGRRRKREDTPPSTTQEPKQLTSTSVINISPLVEQTGHRYGESSRTGRPSEQSILPSPLNVPWEQPSGYGTGSGVSYPQYVAPTLPTRQQQISPRQTRKVKAHVASACVNCKRKHLRCDEHRPCRRCVQSGNEDTCKDVEHKKRGRPPLKPDDSAATRLMPGGISLPPLGPSVGRGGQGVGLAPLLPTPMPSRVPFPQSYAPPSIARSSATARGVFSSSQRPLSFPPGAQHVSNIPYSLPSSAAPTYSFPSQGQPLETTIPTGEYPNPLFPRRNIPSQLSSSVTAGSYGASPFQLPPILPAPAGTTVDPVMAQQQRQYQPQYSQYPPMSSARADPATHARDDDSSDRRDSKRPRMDIGGMLRPRE